MPGLLLAVLSSAVLFYAGMFCSELGWTVLIWAVLVWSVPVWPILGWAVLVWDTLVWAGVDWYGDWSIRGSSFLVWVKNFLQSVNSEYSDVLYYTKVRWLCVGNVSERVWKLRK